jgi:hypothetical protein
VEKPKAREEFSGEAATDNSYRPVEKPVAMRRILTAKLRVMKA